MRHFWMGLAAAGALVALTGCPPTYPKCSSDNNCKDHSEVCVQGQCQECATDANCKTGFVCQQNKCVPKAECKEDGNCATGKKCSAGKCVTPECTKDADCKNGTCQSGNCVLKPGSCNQNEDCPSGQACKDGVCGGGNGDSCDWTAVRFGFNEHTLTADAQQHLSSLAECIKKAGLKVRLEGHADERGTEEYNLQLSNRRSASVKKYLADLGVSAGKLETVGYGANRPVSQGHTEEAWAENRRVEFKH